MKKVVNKLIALVLVVAFIVPLIPFSNGVKAEELPTVKIYASKVKTETSDYYEYHTNGFYGEVLIIKDKPCNIEFIVDTDIEFGDFHSGNKNNLTIKGDKKLTINAQLYTIGSYVQESGSKVFSNEGFLMFAGSANIKSGAVININAPNNQSEYLPTLYAVKDLNISGSVTVNSGNYGIVAKDDINITGGEVHSTALYCPLDSEKNINITGGNVYLHGKNSSSIMADGTINISGGYVETDIDSKQAENKDESDLMIYCAVEGININSPMYIKSPAECSVIKDENTNKYTIVNKDGECPSKVIIADKAAEEAAKKSAEEEAARKAAEEAARKAAEEAAKNKKKYSNEWVDGKWYNADGICDYAGILSWKQNETGWWVEDTLGWYPKSQWQKIDGKWYYFLDDGYMDYGEYRDGCWLGDDGAWVEEYANGHWCNDSNGWWYEDNGWYPVNQYLWIDRVKYWFDSEGYWR